MCIFKNNAHAWLWRWPQCWRDVSDKPKLLTSHPHQGMCFAETWRLELKTSTPRFRDLCAPYLDISDDKNGKYILSYAGFV